MQCHILGIPSLVTSFTKPFAQKVFIRSTSGWFRWRQQRLSFRFSSEQFHASTSKDKILGFSLWSARPFQGFHGCWNVSIVFHFLLHQFPHLLLQRFPRCKVVDLKQKWFRFSSLPGMQWLGLELLDQPIGSIYDSALVFEVPAIIWQNLRTLSLSPPACGHDDRSMRTKESPSKWISEITQTNLQSPKIRTDKWCCIYFNYKRRCTTVFLKTNMGKEFATFFFGKGAAVLGGNE